MILTPRQLAICEMQGRIFERSASENLPSRDFIAFFMASDVAARIESPWSRFQWLDDAYCLEHVIREMPEDMKMSGDIWDTETLFWTGFTYRYWQMFDGTSSAEIVRIAPPDRMYRTYPGFHTLDCEAAIARLIELHRDDMARKGKDFSPVP